MKDSEFIALLNLYIDHEITVADAARLEAEVQSNPERHQIYRQYCRMQKACTVLAQDFQTEQLSPVGGKVLSFDQPARRAPRVGQMLAFGNSFPGTPSHRSHRSAVSLLPWRRLTGFPL